MNDVKFELDWLRSDTGARSAWYISFFKREAGAWREVLSDDGVFCISCKSCKDDMGLAMLPVSFFSGLHQSVLAAGSVDIRDTINEVPAMAEKFGHGQLYGSAVRKGPDIVGLVGIGSVSIDEKMRSLVDACASRLSEVSVGFSSPASAMQSAMSR